MKGAWTSLFFLWTATVLAAVPSPLPQLSHRTWQTEQGLVQNSGLALTQTPDGYLWVGTWEGLQRFDGIAFVSYDRHQSPPLQTNSIRALAPAAEGGVWIGGPLGLEHLRNDVVTVYPEAPGAVRALQVDGPILWVGTHRRGLWSMRAGHWRELPGTRDLIVAAVVRDASGGIWVGTEQGLYRIRDGVLERVALPVNETQVEAVTPARSGGVWASTRNGLLFHLSASGAITPRPIPDRRGIRVQRLLEDREGTLWIGTQSHGVLRLVGRSLSTMGAGQGLGSDSVEALLEDDEGNVWVGTEGGGLHRFNQGPALPFGVSEGLPVANVSSLFEDASGDIWLGTLGGGVVRRSGGRFTTFGPEQGLDARHIRAIGQSADGNVWVGGRNDVIWRLRDGVFERWGPDRGVRWSAHRAIASDAGGTLWVASELGLARLVGERFELLDAQESLCRGGALTLQPSRAGGLWLVSEHGALVERKPDGTFHQRTAELEPLRVNPSAIYEDSDGVVWIGTGLGMIRVQGNRVDHLTRAHGLLDDVVFSIVEDARGNLWTGSNRGVFRVSRAALNRVAYGSPEPLTVEVFGTADGMRSHETNGSVHPSALRDRAGMLWFPTIRGAVRFAPDALSTPPRLNHLHIDRIRLDGRAIRPGGPVEPPAGTERLEFSFSSPYLHSPDKVRFRYRMEGIDRGWIDADASRSALYMGLPPGRFTFHVEAARLDGPWSEGIARSVPVIITPTLTETWWFRGTLGLLLALVIVGLASWRTAAHRARERELEERVRERTAELATINARLLQAEKLAAVGTLAAGVGHEINNPLAYVLNNVTWVHGELSKLATASAVCAPPGVAESIRELELPLADALEGVQRVQRIVADLRTFSRPQTVRRQEQVKLERVLELALNMAAGTLRHRARVEREYASVPDVLGDASRLGQLFLNLVMNAAQALPEGNPEEYLLRVCIAPADEGDAVVVEVTDSGEGIPADVLPRIFDPFFTTKPVGVGIGMGLSISHAIAEAHGGSIQVESEPGRGTTFRVRLPVAGRAAA